MVIVVQLPALLAAMICVANIAVAQNPGEIEAQPRISIVDLFPPVFPPLARQARISGDVTVRVMVRRDGSVASAEVLSGHPMLKQAALDSARKSKFLCQECKEEASAYKLMYTFGFRNDPDDNCGYRRFHASKCLYLWKCSAFRYVGRQPVVGQSADRVMVLADTMCVEP